MLKPAAARAAAAAVVLAAFAGCFALDRFPRFLQGDSVAYLSTGMSGWIPADRSWAYGFASRWIVEAAGHVSGLVAAQAALAMAAVWAFRRFFAERRGIAALGFCAAASLDPLIQTYLRFWLSDAAALAFFALSLCALDWFLGCPRRLLPLSLASLLLLSLLTVLTRIAYAPILLLTAALCLPLSFRPVFAGARLRLLAACLVAPACVAALAQANGVVAMERFRGHPFLNKMGQLYQLGVFAPALRRDDFAAAGAPLTQAHFDAMHLEVYATREDQVWGEDPDRILGFLHQSSGIADSYDDRFQALCGRVMATGLARHPQTFAVVYAATLGLYFWPPEYPARFQVEMGLDRDLPDWVPDAIRAWTGASLPAAATRQVTPLVGILRWTEPFYPLVLLAGIGSGGVLLLRGRTSARSDHLAAAALAATLIATPLYSHAVKARYMLPAVFLSYAAVALAAWPRLDIARAGP